MNNTIFTRKFGLGMLIALVLAFGVQSVADAQSLTVSGDNAITTATAGTPFIEVSDDPAADNPIQRSFNIRVNRAEDDHTIVLAGVTNATVGTVTIPTTPEGASERGGTITFAAPATANADTWSWSGTIRVNYNVTAYGLFEVTVNPSWGDTPGSTKSISAYVVRHRSQTNFYSFSTSARTMSPQTGAESSAKTIEITATTNGTNAAAWTRVEFRISSGSGNLYTTAPQTDDYYYVSGSRIHTDLNSGSRTITAYTNSSGVAAVIYQASSATTSKVRATIPGSTQREATHEVTCFYGEALLERISGNSQVQYPGFGLNAPLEVRVVDSGASNRGVSGQQVTFMVSTPSGHSGLRPASGTTVYRAPGAGQPTYPAETIIVLTDNTGRARVNYSNLPNAAGATIVMASAPSAGSQDFTAHVVEALSSSTVSGATIPASGTTTTPQTYGGSQYTQGSRINIATSAAEVGVDFTVTGGTLHLDPNDLDLTSPQYVSNLYVSSGNNSVASAFVRVNANSTAKVTAHIRGSTQGDSATHVVTYFNGPITFEKVSGDDQIGNTSTNLGEPFVVRVLDGPRPVSGQVVTFAATTGTGTLVKDPGFPDDLYADDFPTTATAMTDSNGRASVLLQLSGTAGAHAATATFDAYTETFEATAVNPEDLARIEIVSGNNQRAAANHELANPLVVIVYDAEGRIVEGKDVEFEVDSSGTLVDRAPNDPGDDPDPAVTTDTERFKTVATDANGEASIRYNVGATTGPRLVHAIIRLDVFDNLKRRVTFNINGSGTPPGQQPSTPNLRVSPASVTGTPGQLVSVTVTGASPGASVQITHLQSTPPLLGSGRADSSGLAVITFNLPSTPNTYNANVQSGAQSRPLTLIVQRSTQQPTGSLVVFPSSVSGAPNEVRNVSVTTSDRQSGIEIGILAPFSAPAKSTLSTGAVSFTLRIPNISPGNYTARVIDTAGNYRETSLRLTVTGTTTPTPTQTPVRLIVPSGASNRLSGATGTNVQLRVQVVNNSNVGVRNVDVAFRDSSGRNLSTVQTNSSGEARVTYRVGSTTEVVTAVITDTDVDRSSATPITFTISSTGQQPTTGQLTIIQTNNAGQTSTSGAPGALHTIRVLLPQRTANQRVILDLVRASDRTNVGTYVLSSDVTGTATTPNTFRLPTTPGQYTITATSTTTAGTNTGTATVTVISIRLLKDSSDSVSGDNQEGERGEVLDDPFVVKVVTANTAQTPVQGVRVTFTVVDGDGELSTSSSATSGTTSLTVNSDSSGDVRAYLVLGEDDEDNRVRASVGITNVADVFFDATGALVPGDIVIVSGNNQQLAPNQRSAPMVVRVTDEDGDDLEGAVVTFSLRGGSGTLTPRSAETDRNGEAEAELVPRDAGTYFIEARVTGVTSVRFTITVGELADTIEIVSGNNQSGEPGTELDDPLVVEVLDDDDDPVSGVTVTFSVTAGGGSLSDTSVTTNSRGRAQTDLTLGDELGRNTVRASVSGVSDRATFTATAEDPAPPEPDVRLPAAQRADTYWINTESGTLHRLVGSSVEDIAPTAQNVVSLVVTDNRLYWVERTSSNSGRIRRSNLNGSNIQLIRTLTTAPAGITVDTVNNKIYVTTERGKIQQINVDGSQYEPNLLVGLDTPNDIAVDTGSGKIFWITETGSVHYANVDGSGETQLASGYSTLGSIAVGADKVFWTEETSDSAGKIHSADVDGSNVRELISLNAAPYGISVDAAAKKLYWTNSRGKIMQSNLNGRSLKAVVSDLVSLGDVSVPSGVTATRPPGTFSKYDVNRDGTVDNTDAALVADALGESPPSNPRLDVNDDGSVNFLDLLLVFDNRDNTNAAPVAVADKPPKVSREEVQKQINLLIATNNESLTAQHTLAYLQSMLAIVTPEKTRLLANYPNPFNPETWIPYQLATSSDVQITIYNAAGRVVRTLTLGHQSKGYYTDQSRAAYWDGRNVIGEQVSSGVYFYTLTTDTFSATRKMLILK